MSREKEPTSGGPDGVRRASKGAPEKRRDGRGRRWGRIHSMLAEEMRSNSKWETQRRPVL